MSDEVAPLSQAEIEALFQVLAAHLPGDVRGARGPKEQPDPFRSCISCILSAQSLDRNTRRAVENLFALAVTPEAMLSLEEDIVRDAIQPAGLYNSKTRAIRRFCDALLDAHEGVVPADRAALMALPGIGRKCADIVLHFTFGQPVIAVDTHVGRVCRRTGLARGKTEAAIAADLERRAPGWAKVEGHFWLIQLGKRYCTARAPKCSACPLAHLCRTAAG